MIEFEPPKPVIKDRLFFSNIFRIQLERNGYVNIANSLMDQDPGQVQRLVNKQGYILVTGRVRNPEKFTDPRSKWEKRTYVFDPSMIEAAIIARNGEVIADEDDENLRIYEQGYPLLYIENERGRETLILKPV